MTSLNHYPSCLISYVSILKLPLIGKEETYLPLKKEDIGNYKTSQSYLSAWQGHGADSPGNYAKARGKSRDDW